MARWKQREKVLEVRITDAKRRSRAAGFGGLKKFSDCGHWNPLFFKEVALKMVEAGSSQILMGHDMGRRSLHGSYPLQRHGQEVPRLHLDISLSVLRNFRLKHL